MLTATSGDRSLAAKKGEELSVLQAGGCSYRSVQDATTVAWIGPKGSPILMVRGLVTSMSRSAEGAPD